VASHEDGVGASLPYDTLWPGGAVAVALRPTHSGGSSTIRYLGSKGSDPETTSNEVPVYRRTVDPKFYWCHDNIISSSSLTAVLSHVRALVSWIPERPSLPLVEQRESVGAVASSQSGMHHYLPHQVCRIEAQYISQPWLPPSAIKVFIEASALIKTTYTIMPRNEFFCAHNVSRARRRIPTLS